MTRPERWLESRDAPSEVLELLENARAPSALDAAARDRSRRRLAALSAVPVAAGVTFWFQKVALGALLGGAIGVAALAPQWWPSSPEVESKGAVTPPRAVPATPVSSARAPSVVSEHDSGVPSAPTPRGSSAPPSAPDVAGEARLLEAARGLLETSPTAALRALQRHEREYRSGTLHVEREFLRVDALVRLGRTAEARERARALRRRAPGHLYEQRLKSLLGPNF